MVGKRVGPAAAAAAAAPMGNPSCLIYLVDVASSKQYLVDSGSTYSILPHQSSAEPTRSHLMTADGKPLHCRLLVDIRNKWLVAPGSKLIQLEQGKPTKAAVVTGVVAVPPPPVMVPSPPSFPLWRYPAAAPQHRQQPSGTPGWPRSPRQWQRPRRRRYPPLHLHIPQWRHPAPAVAHQGSWRPAGM